MTDLQVCGIATSPKVAGGWAARDRGLCSSSRLGPHLLVIDCAAVASKQGPPFDLVHMPLTAPRRVEVILDRVLRTVREEVLDAHPLVAHLCVFENQRGGS